jgi:hypothetical protein
MPETKPTAAPIARMSNTLIGMSAIGRYSCTRVRFGILALSWAETAHGVVLEAARIASRVLVLDDIVR